MPVFHTRRRRVLIAIALTAVIAMSHAAAPAEKNDAVQIEEQGLRHYYGWNTPVDRARAITLFEQGAKLGRPVSQWMLAVVLSQNDNVTRGSAHAFELARSAALQGLPAAQSMVGWMYLRGSGVARDPAQAAPWFSAAAQQGEAFAFYELAGMYRRGEGVAADPDLSFRLLTRSAELHYLGGMYSLAWMNLSGRSVKRDWKEAARWMRQASDGGKVSATFWLSEMHSRGLGVAPDADKAESLLKQAVAKATVEETNDFAWTLAVDDDPELRDGVLALRLMQGLGDELRPEHVDTLAAAFAEAGEFEKASTAQLQAINAFQRKRGAADILQEMQARLQLYRAGKAYREKAP